MKTGNCTTSGRHPPSGLTLFSWYSFIISSLSFWRSPLCFACSFLISGCRRCIASIERDDLAVSGNRRSITVIVSRMIATPSFGTMRRRTPGRRRGRCRGIKHRSACSHGRTCVRGTGSTAAAPRMAAPQPSHRQPEPRAPCRSSASARTPSTTGETGIAASSARSRVATPDWQHEQRANGDGGGGHIENGAHRRFPAAANSLARASTRTSKGMVSASRRAETR